VAVVCIGLGVGVSSTTFSMVDGILFQSLPFDEPDRLVNLGTRQTRNRASSEPLLSYPDFLDWRERNTVFSDVAGTALRGVTLSDGQNAERYRGALVTWNLFSMLGTQPALGRGFVRQDDRPGAQAVVIVSDDVWQRRYAGDRSVIGRSIMIDGQPHTVIGVMPPRFGFPFTQQLWLPLEPILRARSRAERPIVAFARLGSGVSLEQARGQMTAIADRLASGYADDRGWGGEVRSLRQMYNPPEVRFTLLLLMAAGGCVLLIACANIANLMLARATGRRAEMALRFALGASKRRVVRQFLVESTVLGLAGTPGGLAFAWCGVKMFDRAVAASSSNIPYTLEWGVDARVVAYAVVVTVITGMACGMAGAFRAAGEDLQSAIRSGSRGSGTAGGRHRLRNVLVVSEVAVSMVLLIGAGLFVRSFLRSYEANGGIDTAPVMTLRLWLPENGYSSPEQIARGVDQVVNRVEAIPGVEAATASGMIPLEGGSRSAGVLIDGRVVTAGEEPQVRYAGVTAHFFHALGVSLRSGRDFTDVEGATTSGVAVINHTMAARLWPSSDALGRQFRFVDAGAERFTVIGVVPDISNEGLVDEREPVPSAYVPYPYMPVRDTGLMVRVVGDPAAMTPAIRAAVRSVDSGLALASVRTMTKLRHDETWAFTFVAWAFGIVGAIALVLAAVGVYGVLAYAVSQRRYEIGVRIALGARPADVVRMVVSRGMWLCGGGVFAGLVGALAVSPVIGRALYQVSPADPVTLIGVSLFLCGVGVLASYVPARQASRVDPAQTLRKT
jgi:putative ABC transport system permease protein